MIALIVLAMLIMLYIIYQLHSRLTAVEQALSFQIKLTALQSGLLTILMKDQSGTNVPGVDMNEVIASPPHLVKDNLSK